MQVEIWVFEKIFQKRRFNNEIYTRLTCLKDIFCYQLANHYAQFDNKTRSLTTVLQGLPTSCQLELTNCNLPLSLNLQSCLSRVPEILSLYNEPTATPPARLQKSLHAKAEKRIWGISSGHPTPLCRCFAMNGTAGTCSPERHSPPTISHTKQKRIKGTVPKASIGTITKPSFPGRIISPHSICWITPNMAINPSSQSFGWWIKGCCGASWCSIPAGLDCGQRITCKRPPPLTQGKRRRELSPRHGMASREYAPSCFQTPSRHP